MLTDLQNSFTVGKRMKFLTKLNSFRHTLKHIAALP